MSRDSTKRKPLRLAAVLMGVGLLGYFIVRTGVGNVIAHVRAVGWGMLVILALGGLSHLIRAWAWRLTFRSDLRGLSLWRTFMLRLISEAIGVLGVAGQVVGDTLRVTLLGPVLPIADRISSVALDRGIYTVCSAVIGIAGVLASLVLLSLTGAWRVCAIVFAASIAAVLVLTGMAFKRRWRLLSASARALQRLPWARRWLENKLVVIESAEESLLSFHSHAPMAFWGAVVLNLSSQILALGEVYLVLRFMGVNVTPVAALVIEGFTKLINVVGAVNPGNIGTYEGGNLLLSRMLGYTPGAGLTLALCRRARTLFWAGIGALCLIGLSRRKEQNMQGYLESSQPDTAMGGEQFWENGSLAVIIVVESFCDTGTFIPALARVGSLPVVLRNVLSAQSLRPSRTIVSLPSSIARIVKKELLRTGRLPDALEWHERASDEALSSLIREAASTAARVVLLSGSTTFKPCLLQVVNDWKAEDSESFVYETDSEAVGICGMSREGALRIASKVDNFESIDEAIRSLCSGETLQAPEQEWQKISSPETVRAAERKLDSWLVKPTDGVYARMNRRISIPISRQLIKTPLTPNMVTLLILGVSIASGFYFSRGGYWDMLIGALLSVWASILDGCDGEVARMKLLSSDFGCWLDTICDYLYYLLVFVGIAVGLNKGSGSNAYLGWGAALLVGAALSFVVVSHLRHRMSQDRPDAFLKVWQKKAESQGFNPLLFLGRHCEFIIRRCFFPYALLFFALFNLTRFAFVATAVGANLVWTIALYSSFAFSGRRPACEVAYSGD